MKNETVLLYFLSIIIFFSCQKKKGYQPIKILNPIDIKFQLLDGVTDEPISNEKIYLEFYNLPEHSHQLLPDSIDSLILDKDGHFIIDEIIFEKNKLRKIYTKDDSLYLGLNPISEINYQNKKIKTSHDLENETITSSNYSEVKIYRYSKLKRSIHRYRHEKSQVIDSMILSEKSQKEIWQILWTEFSSNQNYSARLWYTNYLGWAHMRYNVLSKNGKIENVDINLNSIIEIVQESENLYVKYNFLYSLCMIYCGEGYYIPKTKHTEEEGIKILDLINDFYENYPDFLKNQKEIWEGCHYLQKMKGRLILEIRSNKPTYKEITNIRNCCELGK